MVGGGKHSININQLYTSGREGPSLGEMERVWEEVAVSEARIRMMDRLAIHKIGFNDVEHFNLGLVFNSKMMDQENPIDKNDRKIVEAAMKFKRKDEIRNRRRIIGEKIRMKKMVEKDLINEQIKIKKIMRYLNQKATRKRKEMNEKYGNKITHLKRKYENDKTKELDRVPEEMELYGDIAVFSEEKFEKVKVTEIEVVKYGDVELDGDEEAAMRLHPKMAIPRRLEEGYMSLAMEMSFTKVRWQFKKEEDSGEPPGAGREEEELRGEEEERKDRIRKEENEIEEAKTRKVYDCTNKVYDERKQRVTDLKECSRIYLPKPMEVKKEAQIELRREMHARASEKYREEKCDRTGRQERNITVEEQRGLKKLEKRKNAGEIVVITTDKSSKMCVMKREDYLKLGEEHVGKDKLIDREEAVKREKLLNQHALAWCRMWRTGENHGHEDRVRQSKVTSSENRAELYLTYKDHKSVPGKTRPIATGCTSNTLALSSSVSTLVESLATSEESKVEVISTEDLMYNVGKHDEEVGMMRLDIQKRKLRKLMCKSRTHSVQVKSGSVEVVEKLVEEMVDKMMMMAEIKNMILEMIEEIGGGKENLQLGLQDPDKAEQPGLGSSLPALNITQNLTGGSDVKGRGADHEILRESSASREAGLLTDPVVLAGEIVEVGGPCIGAPDPPTSSGGLLAGGRTLVKQGLTTHQEPTWGEDVEEITESIIREKLRKLEAEI